MDDIVTLQAEVERLRELLIENGIDPDPYVAPPPQFGPPTRFEHMMQQATAKLFAQYADALLKPNPFLAALAYVGADTMLGQTLRIRLPTDYSVTP